MCGRYILVQKLELIKKRFNVTAPEGLEWKPAYNISPGQVALVITSDNPKELQLFHFGMTPFWAKKPMYMINARAEGKDLLKPIGERVAPEYDVKTTEGLELQGMGSGKNFAYDPEWPLGRAEI